MNSSPSAYLLTINSLSATHSFTCCRVRSMVALATTVQYIRISPAMSVVVSLQLGWILACNNKKYVPYMHWVWVLFSQLEPVFKNTWSKFYMACVAKASDTWSLLSYCWLVVYFIPPSAPPPLGARWSHRLLDRSSWEFPVRCHHHHISITTAIISIMIIIHI